MKAKTAKFELTKIKIALNKDTLLTLILILYFCSMPIVSALTMIFNINTANIAVNTLLFICILTYCASSEVSGSSVLLRIPTCKNRWKKKNVSVFLIYFLITLTIFLTIVLHPEYTSWYEHNFYGISKQIFNLRGGIWALLIISLYEDEERLLHDLKIVTALVFLLYFGKFVAATYRGYWIIQDASGGFRRESYDMEFGFRVLFACAFWGAQAFLNNDKEYLFLYFFGVLVILLGGSRGPIIWAVSVFFLTIPFKYKSLSKKKKNIAKIGILLVLLIILNAKDTLIFIGNVLKYFGLSSRTIVAFSEGSFLAANGRNIIYSMAVDLIKKGGILGYGFYGDRYYIGNYFRWGYAHNIFLELIITFGLVVGTIIIIKLISGLVKLFKVSQNSTMQVIVVTFLATSLKLVLSGSFWYEPSFWALVALMIIWNNSNNKETNIQ